MYLPREISSRLEKELATHEAMVLTGMRQVGKTTLLKHLFNLVPSQNKAFFDFENPLETKLFEETDFDQILSNLASRGINKNERAYIFIDEIQNLPVISRVAKYLIDHYKTKFFLTGSSSFYIKNLFPESMAGRKIIFEIFPLTFKEFLLFKGAKKQPAPVKFADKAKKKNETENIRWRPFYEEYLTYGGFPAVVLENNVERKQALLAGIFRSYFEKDVKTLAQLTDRSKLRDLILLLVPRMGNLIELEKIVSELGSTRATVYNYLNFLEETYFLTLLPRFSHSIDRSRAGRRKLFFADTGLANFLGKVSEGQLLENSVFQTLRSGHQLSFYHRENSEIDFIVNGEVGLEVKTTASRRDILTLKQRSAPLKLKENYLVSLNWSGDKEVIVATDL